MVITMVITAVHLGTTKCAISVGNNPPPEIKPQMVHAPRDVIPPFLGSLPTLTLIIYSVICVFELT